MCVYIYVCVCVLQVYTENKANCKYAPIINFKYLQVMVTLYMI